MKAAWERFLGGESHVAAGVLRGVIDDSWRRCLFVHVDPGRGAAPQRVALEELEALRARNERLMAASAPFLVQSRAYLAQTGAVIILTDPEGVVLDVEGDPRIRESIAAFGMLPGNNWSEASIGTNAIGTALASGLALQVHGAEHFCEPIQRWTCSATPIRDPLDGSTVGVLDITGLGRDYSPQNLPLVVTTANSIENRLAQMELELRFLLLEASVVRLAGAGAVMVFDLRGRLVKANERAAPVLAARGVMLSADTRISIEGCSPPEASVALPESLLVDSVEPVMRGRALLGYVVSLPEGVISRSPSPAAVLPASPPTRSVREVRERSGEGGAATVDELQRRLEFLSTRDSLTGLANRSSLSERLADCLDEARRTGERVAVLLIDLDNFKHINDTLGHEFGDLLLEQVADRLRRCLCRGHTLARIGGDEFAAILRGGSADEVRRLVAQTLEYLSASFCIREQEVFAAASIGVSIFPADGDSASALLKNADTALHEAKVLGRNRSQFFASRMQIEVQTRMNLETGLRAALDSDRFRVVYQPQHALEGGALVGAEALLRWHDPALGDVPPGRFIPAAEEAGLIVAINRMVMAKVLAQIALWRMRGLAPPRISINVAAQELRDPDFVDQLCEQLECQGVPAEAICLELTEGTLLEDIEGTAQTFASLRQRGIAVSIDDFGTGYSSLSYLTRLPVHELKVDQSFVQGIAGEAGKRSIITAIVEMAHALGIEVLAEGIETESQLAFLKERHCEMGQGYLFHRPLGPDEFEKLIHPAVSAPVLS
ncbi:MAG TPA: EAL domain-containing protein [Aromatoleum sp.]|uniref:putative bifunctional diguanylate cyclase/phosphodiesterase n=1 Tax=Aromatoleum sp. TaxID=2307007 RepID=UPI002B489E32|nr:EAL domain-containing protein [Aromatoleum sp.]HJV28771.1 EAL domain-containing protein [Aromatoleum sp.]